MNLQISFSCMGNLRYNNIKVINEPHISQDALAEKLGATRRTVQRKMKDLKLAGRIERIGSKRYGYWQINESKQD